MTRVSPVRSIDAKALVSHRFTEDERQSGIPLRARIHVRGVVQGVGFRPFVHRVAERLGMSGFVRNVSSGVEIEAQGSYAGLVHLLGAMQDESPPIAEIQRVDIDKLAPREESGFRVVESKRSGLAASLISPDVATCEDCIREMNDPHNRRFNYPFINCTNCGPRFTIIEEVPYDRIRTTMRGFDLCACCAEEFGALSDRRYHAEPVACGLCGPRAVLLDRSGEVIAHEYGAIEEARWRLRRGEILAVKGLGGFHLACDAANEKSVSRMREWKGRPHKPLAVMCRDIDTAKAYCHICAAEERVLSSPQRPILLLVRRVSTAGGRPALAESVAPSSNDLGVMLPYTPLHHLLFTEKGPACLIMTSGNRGEEPMVIDNDEAVRSLSVSAGALLVHDRAIWNRCDDSVGFVKGERLHLMRRSRGFVPLPVHVDREMQPTLALGSMLNHTFALAHDRRVFLSQHIGDVDSIETLAFLRESIGKFRRWLGIDPEIIAHDLHPDYLTTHLASELAGDRRTIGVQHHHAHFAAALAAARVEGEAQGWVLDGTGWGTDGTIWGGELLVGTAEGVRRAAHLRPLPLPGGEAAIHRPLRLAAAYLHLLVPESADAPLDLWHRAEPGELSVIRRMVDKNFNTPMTSSAGRLFDAVAALLGVRDDVTYEGQAAIELEQIARSGHVNAYSNMQLDIIDQDETLLLDPQPLLEAIVKGLLAGDSVGDLALSFHEALAQSLVAASACVREAGGPSTVVLCGGVFQNRILMDLAGNALQSAGLRPVIPDWIPVNDAGISLGQVLIANAIVRKERE